MMKAIALIAVVSATAEQAGRDHPTQADFNSDNLVRIAKEIQTELTTHSSGDNVRQLCQHWNNCRVRL